MEPELNKDNGLQDGMKEHQAVTPPICHTLRDTAHSWEPLPVIDSIRSAIKMIFADIDNKSLKFAEGINAQANPSVANFE